MSKKRGLSIDEKRHRMLQIFYEKKTFFQLKELEKIAPKEKGITPMSVKEVLQSLVDDSLVDTERIGTSNYFWSFPSKALHARQKKISMLNDKIAEHCKQIQDNKRKLEEVKQGKELTDERTSVLSELSNCQNDNARLKKELYQYRESDPDVLKEIANECTTAQEAANRWTDNIFALKSWCHKRFNIDEKMLDKQFDIPEDLDYVE